MPRVQEDRAASWWPLAGCLGYPTEWWYPERGKSNSEADRICDSCPVEEPCRIYGDDDPHGVWGGKRASERVAARRARRRNEGCVVCTKPIMAERRRYCSEECSESVIDDIVAAARLLPQDGAQLRLLWVEPVEGTTASMLTAERVARAISATDAAALCGVSEARYMSWEEGRLHPAYEDAFMVSRFLNLRFSQTVILLGYRQRNGTVDSTPDPLKLFAATS